MQCRGARGGGGAAPAGAMHSPMMLACCCCCSAGHPIACDRRHLDVDVDLYIGAGASGGTELAPTQADSTRRPRVATGEAAPRSYEARLLSGAGEGGVHPHGTALRQDRV
eukprot:SAG31_NODE_55_length_29938_cov_9.154027_1_plen_110_part_00